MAVRESFMLGSNTLQCGCTCYTHLEMNSPVSAAVPVSVKAFEILVCFPSRCSKCTRHLRSSSSSYVKTKTATSTGAVSVDRSG